ncbi:hypothetical protein [Arthrobacter sp. TMN-50]
MVVEQTVACGNICCVCWIDGDRKGALRRHARRITVAPRITELGTLPRELLAGALLNPLPHVVDADLVEVQEAIRIVAPADGPAKGSVTGLKSLGAHTLVRVTGHGQNQPNGPTAVLTIEVPGDPVIRIGQEVGLQLVNATGWAVTQ